MNDNFVLKNSNQASTVNHITSFSENTTQLLALKHLKAYMLITCKDDLKIKITLERHLMQETICNNTFACDTSKQKPTLVFSCKTGQ